MHWIYLKDYDQEKVNLLKNRTENLKGVSIPVFCVELNKIFNSAAEAGKELEIDSSAIRKVIRGKNKTAGGFHWIEKKELISIGNFKKE